jgi:hypothetical protein
MSESTERVALNNSRVGRNKWGPVRPLDAGVALKASENTIINFRD